MNSSGAGAPPSVSRRTTASCTGSVSWYSSTSSAAGERQEVVEGHDALAAFACNEPVPRLRDKARDLLDRRRCPARAVSLVYFLDYPANLADAVPQRCVARVGDAAVEFDEHVELRRVRIGAQRCDLGSQARPLAARLVQLFPCGAVDSLDAEQLLDLGHQLGAQLDQPQRPRAQLLCGRGGSLDYP